MLREADDEELAEITAIRRRAATSLRILPRAGTSRRPPLVQSLPGATGETQPYAEDIYDELQQVVADFTAIEDRCSGLLSLHAALASKTWRGEPQAGDGGHYFPAHLLPCRILGTELYVLTGRIEKGWPAFLVLGVGLNVACVVVIVVMLSRRSWN